MGINKEFTGFPKEGLQFLEELESNNNREWFQSRKSDYQEYLIEPARLFVTQLGERLKTLSSGIVSDTRTNGSGTIMRIYRDIRFSQDKTPYNTQVRMIFWEGKEKKMDNPGFYFCFNGKEGNIFSGYWFFPKSRLEHYRDAVMDEELGPGLEEALITIKSSGDYTIGGEQYKRIPREFDPIHDRAYLLKYKGLYAGAPVLEPGDIMSEKLIDICYEHCKNMAPLHNWLVKVNRIGSG